MNNVEIPYRCCRPHNQNPEQSHTHMMVRKDMSSAMRFECLSWDTEELRRQQYLHRETE